MSPRSSSTRFLPPRALVLVLAWVRCGPGGPASTHPHAGPSDPCPCSQETFIYKPATAKEGDSVSHQEASPPPGPRACSMPWARSWAHGGAKPHLALPLTLALALFRSRPVPSLIAYP